MSTPTRRPSAALILTIALVVIGLALVVFFGLGTLRQHRRVQMRGLMPGVTDVETIRSWMTLPYVARAYGVPQAVIFERLGIPEGSNEALSIKELADKYNRDPTEMLQTVQEAVRRYLAVSAPVHPPASPP